jgi:hypothetical protein
MITSNLKLPLWILQDQQDKLSPDCFLAVELTFKSVALVIIDLP